MIKKILILILALIPSLSFGLHPQKGVVENTVKDINTVEARAKIKLWTWVGFVEGNNEFDPLHKVKKRSTLIAHNENVDAKEHFIIVWFHGMHGYKQSSFEGVYNVFHWLNEHDRSFTWIMPELPWSANVSNIEGRTAWAKSNSFKTFVDDAWSKVPQLQKKKKIRIVIAGHSRGGKAIANAAKYGGLCKVNPEWILWSDSTYGHWLETAWQHCLKDIPVYMEIYFMAGTETQASVKRFEKNNSSLLVDINPLRSPWYHGKIGNTIIQMSKLFNL